VEIEKDIESGID